MPRWHKRKKGVISVRGGVPVIGRRWHGRVPLAKGAPFGEGSAAYAIPS